MSGADPQTIATLAALHARCFTDAPPPWSAAALAAALEAPGSVLLAPAPDRAFLLGRVIAGEAELLTLAVAPEARRQGLAADLCRAFAATARAAGAGVAFLEVAATNHAARALYSGEGWVEAGLRRGYYGPGVDGVVMRLDLAAGQDSG